MTKVPLATADDQIGEDKFWKAVLLYHDRPHLINRRLLGVSQALFLRVSFNSDAVKSVVELLTRSAILYEVRRLPQLLSEFIDVEFFNSILKPYDKNVSFEACTKGDLLKDDDGTFLSFRILLPRQISVDKCVEVVVFDRTLKSATFIAVAESNVRDLAPNFAYTVALTSGYLSLWLESFEDAESASADWLTEQLFLKLMKWTEDDLKVEAQGSLSLVSVEFFTRLYHDLKVKYGKSIVERWPENTDPHKFVYEDLAIAAYLIALWNSIDPNKKPTFVDLGCGNGLLTYILIKEGYPGTGIDVRRRKIWDMFPEADLKEETVTPSSACLFPNADWIIGNHSDELTPWIPVIAFRSSERCNIFLLPCCAYDFDGKKYKRKDTGVSVYCDYLRYVESICATCGFKTAIDRLRIPSTKRTCLVSFGRCHDEASDVDRHVRDLIGQSSTEKCWSDDFTAREPKEKVRNCTQIERGVVARIVKEISSLLLTENVPVVKESNGEWNKGCCMPLSLIAKSLSKDDLKVLKNECGGVQTLLRNHRYIFEVSRGSVCLRLPPTALTTNFNYKGKLCWFSRNHPDGCLHSEEVCAYQH